MSKQRKTRGRPKEPWEPFANELLRRMIAGEALKTVEAEAKYLSDWAKTNPAIGLKLAAPQIRERIKKRFNGAAGYKDALEHARIKLEHAVRIRLN